MTDKKIKAYIAGPMMGYPCRNYEAFFYWAHRIKADQGWDIENPAEYDCRSLFKRVRIGFTYPGILLKDLKLISKCDCIVLLPDWSKSYGAKTELAFAKAVGKDIYEINEETNNLVNITGEKRTEFISND